MNRNNIPNEPFRYNLGGVSFDSCSALESRCKSDQECSDCHLYEEALAVIAQWDMEDKEEFKQIDITKTRALKRHNDYYKAKRRMKIAKQSGFNTTMGRLVKGKVHCSCKMCRPQEEKRKYYEKHKRNYILEYGQFMSDEHDHEVFAFIDEMETEDKYYEGLTRAHEVHALIQKYKTNSWSGEEFKYYFNLLMEQSTPMT